MATITKTFTPPPADAYSFTSPRSVGSTDMTTKWHTANEHAITTQYKYNDESTQKWLLANLAGDSRTYAMQWGGSALSPYAVDPSWQSCQPDGSRFHHYSPGVCPEGHTLAQYTVYRVQTMSDQSLSTYWGGDCCKTGMYPYPDSQSLFSEPGLCISAISEPLVVRAPDPSDISPPATGIPAPFSYNRTSVTATNGFAISQGLSVLWAETDFPNFPPAYASSLAQALHLTLNFSTSTADAGSNPSNAGTSPYPTATHKKTQDMYGFYEESADPK
ncbi:unnamed protein product [Periconia digitata]|uniref:Uncharacterized protein n=1 Tax=Periconia digitata TaxID=1303443 RepID=A0A9W4U5J0_9PLEO|nr:unnamed protein product [Periconia digitata]